MSERDEGLTPERVEEMLAEVQGHLGMTIADIDIAAERGEAWPVDPDALVDALSAGYEATEKLGATIRTLWAEAMDHDLSLKVLAAYPDSADLAREIDTLRADARRWPGAARENAEALADAEAELERKDAALREMRAVAHTEDASNHFVQFVAKVCDRTLAPVADQTGGTP